MRAIDSDIPTLATPALRCGINKSIRAAQFSLIGMAFLLLLSGPRSGKADEPPAAPHRARLLILDRDELERAKKRVGQNDPRFMPAARKLQREADRALGSGDDSVTHKTVSSPGGSKHDYVSPAPYWWPNPKTAEGLPYVRRDGEVNPERDQFSDRRRLDSMIQAVKTLSIAYFFFNEDKYAARAAERLRVWFSNDATKMNPHLNYAQAVPGRNQGRGAGIIETHDFPELLDAVALLGAAPAWTQSDHRQLRMWFSSYLRWLLESSQGQEEAKAKNNHGSWFDVQTASYALFSGEQELAKKILARFAVKRIAAQIEPDGRQLRELERAQAWHYSIFNLQALFSAAAIADKVGIDVWNFVDDGKGIRQTLDWLVPFATGEKKWPYKESVSIERERQKLASLLRIAALRYRDPAYEQTLAKLPKVTGEERWQLLYPKIPWVK